MCDGYIVEQDVKVLGTLDQVPLNQTRHLFSLRDQLRRFFLEKNLYD